MAFHLPKYWVGTPVRRKQFVRNAQGRWQPSGYVTTVPGVETFNKFYTALQTAAVVKPRQLKPLATLGLLTMDAANVPVFHGGVEKPYRLYYNPKGKQLRRMLFNPQGSLSLNGNFYTMTDRSMLITQSKDGTLIDLVLDRVRETGTMGSTLDATRHRVEHFTLSPKGLITKRKAAREEYFALGRQTHIFHPARPLIGRTNATGNELHPLVEHRFQTLVFNNNTPYQDRQPSFERNTRTLSGPSNVPPQYDISINGPTPHPRRPCPPAP